MAETPEGKVKKKIDKIIKNLNFLLTSRGLSLYTIKYVPSGYGTNNQLDYTLCIAGHFVVIEAKAPDEWLRPLQVLSCVAAYKSGATVFIISGDGGLWALEQWIAKHERHWHS